MNYSQAWCEIDRAEPLFNATIQRQKESVLLKKAILAAVRFPIVLWRVLQRRSSGSRAADEGKIHREQEAERLDRIRNPHRYGPGREVDDSRG